MRYSYWYRDIAHCSIVVDSLNRLSDHNSDLQNSTTSSNKMTSDIHAQVNHVAELIEQMVTLTTTSMQHAKVSSADLADLVTTTNTMASLSGEIEQTLQNFKSEFAMVKNETGVIENITSQTNLLALNASIEAANYFPVFLKRSTGDFFKRIRKGICSRSRSDPYIKRGNQVLFQSDSAGPGASGRNLRADDRIYGRNPEADPAHIDESHADW